MKSYERFIRTTAPLCVAIFLLTFISGCGKTRWVATHNNDDRAWYVAPGFDFSAMKGKALAIGGVVLRDGSRLDEFCEIGVSRRNLTYEVQADLWSPLLNTAAIRLTPEVTISHWHSVQAHTPDPLREATHGVFAHRGVIKPHLVQEWSAQLPDADYLALVRIEDTWLDSTGQSDWARATGMGRVLALTLDIYDLHEGVSVWSHMVQKHVFSSVRGSATDKPRGRSSDQSTAPPKTVDQMGTTTNAPTLADALEEALAEAMGKLR